jgi:mannitol/fructose-specific phosphotransferase system IIA component (Ntr-type)
MSRQEAIDEMLRHAVEAGKADSAKVLTALVNRRH